jgi:hypothetical protein
VEICSLHAPFDVRHYCHGDDLKNKVKSNLESFLKAKQYYHRLGHVWKRSFVMAMANFIYYDVFDIDLSKVMNDSDLNFLLLQTTSKFESSTMMALREEEKQTEAAERKREREMKRKKEESENIVV